MYHFCLNLFSLTLQNKFNLSLGINRMLNIKNNTQFDTTVALVNLEKLEIDFVFLRQNFNYVIAIVSTFPTFSSSIFLVISKSNFLIFYNLI
jgi:hypothetical protein